MIKTIFSVERKKTWMLPRIYLSLCDSNCCLIKFCHVSIFLKKKESFFLLLPTRERCFAPNHCPFFYLVILQLVIRHLGRGELHKDISAARNTSN